ncbi:MAG: DNA gyrase subunit A, partial [Verrucomicrobiae bacterium]|nr:DNA gyrase subunit A [Verrucomicrobiae bacterium]
TDAILDLRLYQLTGQEKKKIEEEYMALLQLIEELKFILDNESKLLSVIKEELVEMKAKYPSERRTKIVEAEGEFRMEDVIANEGCVISVSHKGFIKRTSVSEYRSQKRGGKGVKGSGSYEEDFIEHVFTASTHDNIMFFMNNGRVYVEKVYEITEGSRISKGRSLINLLQMQENEKIAAMICVPDFTDDLHLVKVTRKGIVKKTNLKEYANYRRGGLIGINIDDDDQLTNVLLTTGDEEILIVTQKGMSIRFKETDLRDQGRATRGVIGIRLKGKDCVKAAVVVNHDASLLLVGENGLGKRSDFEDYRLQSRGGSGVIAMKTNGVAGALSVTEEDEIMILTLSGQAIRSPVKDVRIIGRTTQGVRMMNLSDDDKIVAIAEVVETEDIDEAEESDEGESGTESPEASE